MFIKAKVISRVSGITFIGDDQSQNIWKPKNLKSYERYVASIYPHFISKISYKWKKGGKLNGYRKRANNVPQNITLNTEQHDPH
jgi:hypothetical protein